MPTGKVSSPVSRMYGTASTHWNQLVCLSLLGTFPGPPESKWQGANSSILSVLVSIQAMIFIPDPLENVPIGFKRAFKDNMGMSESESYKSHVQMWTVRYAMLDWLQNNEMRKGLWREVVRTYFERNGGAVLKVVNRWRSTNMLISRFEGELTNALQDLQQNRRY